ncbi:HesA/MoeB/ThiF family protein [Futiania mangrovi]|uniref:Molybdopterin-synthase adenylyltransferase n=1 Tax=Futiania mangrovi TaxID=2959716 RepID=A0A9J6PK44_9PROT|nr:molybdopterin-synthase adenylyltransferase MoeB [Futiania mangrovii]MCP1336442.1 molybdopterin-synthase adenylyltransferase MoeB [Futiania mangrovii]
MNLTDDQLDRYARHIILREVGGAGQARLLASRVLVIGAGGLGAPLLLYLAAAGVGTLGIVDDDAVALSNLQRQVIHDTAAVGHPKTESAAASLARVNPDVAVVAHATRITAENAPDLIAGYDLVADGSDNFATRHAVADACARAGVPLVSAAIGQFDGQLSVWMPYAAGPEGGRLPCYRCLVPDEPPPGAVLNCAEAGVLGAVAGVMGTLQAVEVIKVLLDLGEPLAGRLLLYDALSANFRTLRLPADPGCRFCGDGGVLRRTG